MPRLEYVEPRRVEYDSDLEFQTALIQATIDYRNAQFRAIDKMALGASNAIRTESVKNNYPKPTIHDYLAMHPALLRRYKEIGPMALLEID